MVGVALFGHEDSIHGHVNVSKDGVAKIVNAVGVSDIVGIRKSQIGLQSLIPSHRISQELVEIVVIVRGRDGKRDGSRACQGRLKRHVAGGYVPVIYIGHIKQIERHDAGV